jgi:hypothetical protein
MYHTAAYVTGVLIARAAGMSFGDALRERICDPLGMKDTAFSVAGENISRLATAYQRDDATGEIVIEDGTGWYNDPAEDMTTILMIQRAPAPAGLPILFDFWTAAYQAIDE